MNRRTAKRRRRRPPANFQSTSVAQEQKFLHQAVQNSKLDRTRGAEIVIPWGPTFYPTIEEMGGSPLEYIEKIRPIAQKYGIVKIKPPKGWNPPPVCAEMDTKKKFSTKDQQLHRLQEGISFGDGEEYNPGEYQKYASRFTKEYKARNYPEHDLISAVQDLDDEAKRKLFSCENLEKDYWNIIETRNREISVEYGNDINTDEFGSGFPLSERGRSVFGTNDPEKAKLPEPKFGTEDYYKETWWNINNMPWAPDSVLRHVKVGINGINVPWMYYGSLFTTFCWHNEDNYLYSVNYHHAGAPKQWYGVPGNKRDADGLEKVFKNYLSMKMRDMPDLLHHITTMFSPRLLQNADVPIYKLLQHEGEFVITFPRAFHGGFSMGPNIGEAVNFATHDWIAHGCDASERYRSFARPAVFSHDRLTFTMAHHVSGQSSYKNCRLLLKELERVVEEELQLRQKLLHTGVRDVSDKIELPKNCLGQLDEDSAEYDDKRLCHACKHVCFFSAVACVCSQSIVSCLRHSHYMCRCPVERRYLMVWSPEEELHSTVKRVRHHCESLKVKGSQDPDEVVSSALDSLPPVAVGVERDLAEHKDGTINVEPYNKDAVVWQPIKADPAIAAKLEGVSDAVKQESAPATVDSTVKQESSSSSLTDTDKSEGIVIDDDDDDEIQLIGVRESKNARTIIF